jgi:hypothetical protein
MFDGTYRGEWVRRVSHDGMDRGIYLACYITAE